MKPILSLAFAGLIFSATTNAVVRKAIFGHDNRQEIYEGSPLIQRLSSGVAMFVSELYSPVAQAQLSLPFPTLTDNIGLCVEERYASQPTAMIACTGFLVAPDLMLTAGHCMLNVGEIRNEKTAQCRDFSWVFDYKYQFEGQQNQQILENLPANRKVGCEEVIYAIHKDVDGLRKDFALIKLNKKLPSRHHFKLTAKPPQVGNFVQVLGHPLGLPQKYSDMAYITRSNHHAHYFETNLDTFGGNSGSPVFNHENEVAGILVRGPADFYYDNEKDCTVWNRCSANGMSCLDGAQDPDWRNGMHVQKISEEILELIKQAKESNKQEFTY